MTLEEAWSKEKPSVDYFIVFGCMRHVIFQMPREENLKIKV